MHAITVTALLPWTSFAAPRSAPRCRQLATLRTTRPLCGLREAGDEAHSSKKRHMALMFGFRGTGFYGLQSQSAEGTPGQPTVSDALRRALLDAGAVLPSNFSPLTRTKWTLASRTDKGVHAARAAVSLKMETLDSQLEPLLSPLLDTSGTLPGQFEPLLSPLEPAERAAGPPPQPRLALTAAAVAEINSHLPPEVRLFGGCTVRKSFHCRECASSRSYEYLLPASALGGMGVAEFDAVLSTFEGSHKARRFFCSSS